MGDSKESSILGDLEKIPCFKKTFQISIGSGILAGLASFIFTSRVKRSSDIAVGTFAVTTIIHWVYCRYNWTKEYFEGQKLNSALRNAGLKRGLKQTDSSNNEVASV